MSYNLLWIFLLILQSFTASFPVPNQYDLGIIGIDHAQMNDSPKISRYEDSTDSSDEKVISVRITSSVAVGRGKGKPTYSHNGGIDLDLKKAPSELSPLGAQSPTITTNVEEMAATAATVVPPSLIGANIEYIKQLNAKKESRGHSSDSVPSFDSMVKGQNDDYDELSTKVDDYEEDIHDIPLARKVPSTADANRFQDQKTIHRLQNIEINRQAEPRIQNQHINMTSDSLFVPHIKHGLETNNNKDNKNVESVSTLPIVDKQTDEKSTGIETFTTNSKTYETDDSVAEPSIKSVEFTKYNERIEKVSPTATMPPVHSQNNVQGLTNRPQNEGRNNPRLTTVSFNIVHDTPKTTNNNEPSTSYISTSQIIPNQKHFYDPPKIYSEPAKIYSEPAKFYSEPAKIYSEPAKIYSEPAKVYSEPAKIYSEPSKFYSEPASLHLNQNVPSSIPPNYSPWQTPQRPFGSTTVNTTPISTVTNVFQKETTIEHQPEKNYEVDEKISVLTDGRSHGVQQDTATEKCKQENCKVGYVLEGRQFKKYRVEERTPDGFIVGEYGVVRNEDGALRGVRYTADSDASPRLIHDALMKFLQLT
ncbi:hypothetical protein PYW08_002196 [Mythimna loreyi]|uniref:Uncharacterized protein n=1 Tax=Mythimna loreyi TaxID=667449 RepID=A0ACC2R1A4_9NEOP|nr:hypothetical protein PYW08_002196 [Mythimna loreyi]